MFLFNCRHSITLWSLILRHDRLAVFPRICDHDVLVGGGCREGAKGQWGKLIKSCRINRARKPPSRSGQLARRAKLDAFFEKNPIDFNAVKQVEEKWAPVLGCDCCFTRERDFPMEESTQ